MPQLEELKKLEDEHGFKLLLIDSKGMLGRTREILSEKKITVPLLLDTRSYTRNTLQGMYTPTLFIVDGEGRLRSRLVGSAEDLQGTVTDILERI